MATCWRACPRPSSRWTFSRKSWLGDFLDLAWETLRYRRLKAALVNGAAAHGLAVVLAPLLAARTAACGPAGPESGTQLPSCFTLAERWAGRDREAVAQVDALLAAADLTMDAELTYADLCRAIE